MKQDTYSVDYLIERLHKECENSKGYLGVDLDDLEGETEKERVNHLFFRVQREILYLTWNGYEQTKEFYEQERINEDAPFASEYYVELHIKRLIKFLEKHMRFKRAVYEDEDGDVFQMTFNYLETDGDIKKEIEEGSGKLLYIEIIKGRDLNSVEKERFGIY